LAFFIFCALFWLFSFFGFKKELKPRTKTDRAYLKKNKFLVSSLVCDHNQALEVSLGACLPNECSSDESALLVKHVTKHPVQIRCEPRGIWSTSAIIFCLFISVWFVLVFLATLIHWWTETKASSSIASELILAMSLQRNASDSMRTKRVEGSSFHAAQGIQVLSVFLLTSGYSFFLMMPYLGIFAYSGQF
jgi:hypothetical protein